MDTTYSANILLSLLLITAGVILWTLSGMPNLSRALIYASRWGGGTLVLIGIVTHILLQVGII